MRMRMLCGALIAAMSATAWAQGTEQGTPTDARDQLREAARQTNDRGNYAFTNEIATDMMGMQMGINMDGAFQNPDLIRARVELDVAEDMAQMVPPEMMEPMEIIARGDLIRVKRESDLDWMDPAESGQPMAMNTQFPSPLEAFEAMIDALTDITEETNESINNVDCRQYHATVTGEALRDVLNSSLGGTGDQLDAFVLWDDSSADIRIFVGAADNLVYRVVQVMSLASDMAPDGMSIESQATFRDHGTSTVEIPEELREDLGATSEPEGK